MEAPSKAIALLHPARARIFAAFAEREATTQEVAQKLSDIPLASLYRHVQVLIRSELLTIATEQRVEGKLVRTLRANVEVPLLTSEEKHALTPEELVNLVQVLTETLRARFSHFAQTHPFPLPENEVSCFVHPLYLSDEEHAELRATMIRFLELSATRDETTHARRTIGYFSVPDVAPETRS